MAITNTGRDMAKKILRVLLFPLILVFSYIGLLSATVADKLIKVAGIRGKIEFIWFFE